jgi:hypothetical protein
LQIDENPDAPQQQHPTPATSTTFPTDNPVRSHSAGCRILQNEATTDKNLVLEPTTAKMPGVSVRDVDAQKFINAYAAFLKRQGKLPVPGMFIQPRLSRSDDALR